MRRAKLSSNGLAIKKSPAILLCLAGDFIFISSQKASRGLCTRPLLIENIDNKCHLFFFPLYTAPEKAGYAIAKIIILSIAVCGKHDECAVVQRFYVGLLGHFFQFPVLSAGVKDDALWL